MQVQIEKKFNLQCDCLNDIIRILGVFIDNAIEETVNLESGYITIMAMNTKQGALISVANNYRKKPELALMQQKGYSTKGNGRGMGLYWAEKLIKVHGIIHNIDISEKEVVQEIEIIKE